MCKASRIPYPIGRRVQSKKGMPTTAPEDENWSIAREIGERDRRKAKSTLYDPINEYTWQLGQDFDILSMPFLGLA
jgi:hypothetical protein